MIHISKFHILYAKKKRERSIFVRFSKFIHQIVSKTISYIRKIFFKN